ncbi:hypothetical protein [Peribacillus simplex]|uniref:hypothetical protein n=1 Tax=Peribacillus simplex TaxID=1478 RepID=UPI003D2DE909
MVQIDATLSYLSMLQGPYTKNDPAIKSEASEENNVIFYGFMNSATVLDQCDS